MNIPNTNSCTPLKQQNMSNAPSFGNDGEAYWDNGSNASHSINELKAILNAAQPSEKVSPMKTFLSVLGIAVTSAISAGFLAKKGMNIASKVGLTSGVAENTLKTFNKVKTKLSEVSLEGAGKIKTKAVKFAQDGLDKMKKFAEFGINPEKLADMVPEAKVQNGIINAVSIASGGYAGVKAAGVATNDKNSNGVADLLENSTNKALNSISLLDV